MKLIIICLVLIGLVLKGVHSGDSDGNIKCYVGIGDVGSSGVEERDDGYKSCSVSTFEAGGVRVVTRFGSMIKMEEISGVKRDISYCHTDLCNGDSGDSGDSGEIEHISFTSGVNSGDSDGYIKCYVGTGDFGSSGVREREGRYKSCSVRTMVNQNGDRIVQRGGVQAKMDQPCREREMGGGKAKLCYCHTDLCNGNSDGDIKCYVGTGDVGSSGVKEEDDGYKSCSVAAVEVAGIRIVDRRGAKEKMDQPCATAEISGVQAEMCWCHTDLCNNAPATAAVFLPIIAMALMAKFMD